MALLTPGAECTDGSHITSIVNGSIWSASEGIWTLTGCPPGYYLDSLQCQLCPAAFYCTGGSLPVTPCASGMFALPGATKQESCRISVFVTVKINVRLARPDFTNEVSGSFQDSLAKLVHRDPGYVVVEIVQPGDDITTTDVTSQISCSDAKGAAAIVQNLNENAIYAAFIVMGFNDPNLLSVQVTACVPGYQLLPSQTCQLCPPDFFCTGGPFTAQPCPSGSFSLAGANHSSSCVQVVFVAVVVSLRLAQINFTSSFESKFQIAMAITAGVATDRVVITGTSEGRRAGESSLLVNSDIAADDSKAAAAISSKIEQSSLNKNLASQGLPLSSLVSVTVMESNVQAAPFPLSAAIGGGVGIVVLLTVFTGAVLVLSKNYNSHKDYKAFLGTVHGATTGDPGTPKHLPWDLRDRYQAEQVLRKVSSHKSSCCVVKATDRQNANIVNIKVIVKKNRKSSEGDDLQLKNEKEVLELMSKRECRYAVFPSEQPEKKNFDSTKRLHDYIVLEHTGGQNLHAIVYGLDAVEGGKSSNIITQFTYRDCIAVARDVLAAYKVMHSEDWIHCGVNLSNIIRCESNPDDNTYVYKLADFGTVQKIDEGELSPDIACFMGPMPPELLSMPCKVAYSVDVWLLGAAMFELVAGEKPVLTGDNEDAPKVVKQLADKWENLDNALARVISKALEKETTAR